MLTVSTSSRGRATAGSSASVTLTRLRAAGAPARKSQRWTTKSWAADCAIITTRTSFIRLPVDDTSIGLSATLRTCWDVHLISCLLLVEWGLCQRASSLLHPILWPASMPLYKLMTNVCIGPSEYRDVWKSDIVSFRFSAIRLIVAVEASAFCERPMGGIDLDIFRVGEHRTCRSSDQVSVWITLYSFYSASA